MKLIHGGKPYHHVLLQLNKHNKLNKLLKLHNKQLKLLQLLHQPHQPRHQRHPLLLLPLQLLLVRTRFGSQLRAAVDNQRVAAGLGIDVNKVFLLTFAVGSGLAGLGGALGAVTRGFITDTRDSTWL